MEDNERKEPTVEDLCSMPIEPGRFRNMKAELLADPDRFIEGKKVIPTQIATIDTKAFVAFLELAGDIYAGLDWSKKGRIVVEYDPQEKKFTVATFQEACDVNTDHSPGEYPDYLLRRELRKKL